MRSLILFLASIILSCQAVAQSGQPLQLEMRVPFEPTAFPNEGRMHLLYELHLTNFATFPLYVSRIEVLDVDAAAAEPIAALQAEPLEQMFQAVGGKTPTGQNGSLTIPNG